jgi:hypothetical protein
MPLLTRGIDRCSSSPRRCPPSLGPLARVSSPGRLHRPFSIYTPYEGTSMRHRFGALGKYGSLAVIERGIRTIKSECTRRLCTAPYRLGGFEQELALYFSWYNSLRPHSWLRGATPDEIYHRNRPAIRAPRFEPRRRWPRRSPCASPQTLIRGQPGVRLDLQVQFLCDRRYLPIVTLKRAA